MEPAPTVPLTGRASHLTASDCSSRAPADVSPSHASIPSRRGTGHVPPAAAHTAGQSSCSTDPAARSQKEGLEPAVLQGGGRGGTGRLHDLCID